MENQTIVKNIFGTADYLVFGALITISIAIGIFFAIKDKKHVTSANYFLGDRKLKAIPLGLSYVVTFQSSVILLGSPAEVYVYGLQYAIQIIGVLAAFYLSALIVVPLFHPLKLTSVYEYYQLRYGTKSVRHLGVTLGVLYYTVYMGVVLFGTALALHSTTGLPFWISIVTFTAAASLYTSIGGIKAVVWTDVFQSIVMFSGILAVIVKSTLSAGGPSQITNICKDRINLFNFDPDPTIRHTFWTLVIGSVPQFFYPAVTQAGIQRIISSPHVDVAKRMLYIAAPIYCIAWVVVMFEGLSVYAYYTVKGCDPVASGQISNPNQIIPFTILEMFHDFQGMPGLFIAALAAASLSTISSGLSGLAAVTCIDCLRVLKPNIDDHKATNISKLFVLMYGIISACLAFLLSNVKGPLGEIAMGFSGAVAGPETGMFLVSVFFRRARHQAVFFATCISLIFSLWLIFGQTFSSDLVRTPYLPLAPTDQCHININDTSHFQLENSQAVNITTPIGNISLNNPKTEQLSSLGIFYSISYMYFHLIGTILTIFVAVIGSIFPLPVFKPSQDVNESCVLPVSILVPSFIKKCYISCKRNNRSDIKDNGAKENEKMLIRDRAKI